MDYEFGALLLLAVSGVTAFGVGILYILLNIIRQTKKRLRHSIKMARLPGTITRSLNEARYYARQIDAVAQECPPGPVREHLNNLTIKHVHDSLQNLEKLEQAMCKLYLHRNLKKELRRTDKELKSLDKRLDQADEREAVLIRRLAQSKREHLSTLEELQGFQNQAELEMQRIASDLNTTHAEMLLVVTRGDFNPSRLNRLDENLREHLGSLRDMVAVMDEIGYSRAASS